MRWRRCSSTWLALLHFMQEYHRHVVIYNTIQLYNMFWPEWRNTFFSLLPPLPAEPHQSIFFSQRFNFSAFTTQFSSEFVHHFPSPSPPTPSAENTNSFLHLQYRYNTSPINLPHDQKPCCIFRESSYPLVHTRIFVYTKNYRLVKNEGKFRHLPRSIIYPKAYKYTSKWEFFFLTQQASEPSTYEVAIQRTQQRYCEPDNPLQYV